MRRVSLTRFLAGFFRHRPEEPVLGKQDTQHRLFTAVRKVKEHCVLPAPRSSQLENQGPALGKA